MITRRARVTSSLRWFFGAGQILSSSHRQMKFVLCTESASTLSAEMTRRDMSISLKATDLSFKFRSVAISFMHLPELFSFNFDGWGLKVGLQTRQGLTTWNNLYL